MDKRIVVIEDEEKIVTIIITSLEREGFIVKSAHDGMSGLRMVREEAPDLVILDLMLPGLDGFEICKNIRMDPRMASTPVIILTAKTEECDRVLGLELGADDYVTKPFSPRELVARVKAVLRRTTWKKNTGAKFYYKGLLVDTEACVVKDGEKEVELTPKEFGLLVCLLRNKGHVMSRQMILDSVWGLPASITTRTVDVHIRNLREKIPSLSNLIVTVKQFGYKLKDEE